MGYARLYYARDPKGGLKRISAKNYDAFHFGRGPLPTALADADRMVNVAELYFETEHRALVRLLSVSFTRLGILEDGRPDPEHQALHFQAAAHRMNEAHRAAAGPADPDAVIDAASRFAGKRLDTVTKWTPTEGELELLRSAVGHRLDLGDANREQRERDL